MLTLQAADGQQVPVSFNAAVFKDTAGKVRGIFASARDITAQKQLEVQLQASQSYTRSLIESNIDALMTTDPLGHHHRRQPADGGADRATPARS